MLTREARRQARPLRPGYGDPRGLLDVEGLRRRGTQRARREREREHSPEQQCRPAQPMPHLISFA
jgi:hypothetical protein